MQAGLDGVRQRRDLDGTRRQPLPNSLAQALTLLAGSEAAAEWLGDELHAAYGLFKQAEIRNLQNLDEREICRRYAEVY